MPANLFSGKLCRCYSSENVLLLTAKTTGYIQATNLRSNIRIWEIRPSWLTFLRQVSRNPLFHFQRTFNILYCLLESTEKMPLGLWNPPFHWSPRRWDLVGCSFLHTVFDGTAVALKHPACSPASTLAHHMPLLNPGTGLCFSRVVPIISKQTLCLRDWVMLLLSELLSLPL